MTGDAAKQKKTNNHKRKVKLTTIILDAMGGDDYPEQNLNGAKLAVESLNNRGMGINYEMHEKQPETVLDEIG